MNISTFTIAGLLGSAIAFVPLAQAAVSPEEAAQLKTTLTPVGAERAGNEDGTIPRWDGGVTQTPPGYKTGDARPLMFPNEKPILTITAQNMEQYADRLSGGVKGLVKKYPTTFRVNVYPTHRTAALPQWVYDNTFKNATRARLSADGWNVESAYGGVPFPIPKSGAEAMWNHKLPYLGEASESDVFSYVGTPDGKVVESARVYTRALSPYYFKDNSLETFKGPAQLFRFLVTGPPHKAGDSFMTHDWIGRPREIWQYLPGQRRVRRAPALCCDGPEEVNSGAEYWDEAYGWWGDLKQYDWKLVGKKEIYIPYNNERLHAKQTTIREQIMPHHLNPDFVRWELHRVWVVDATLLKGERNVVPKRRFYIDEDSWGVVLHEGFDTQGALWRMGYSLPFVVAEGPFVHPNFGWSTHNLLTGGFMIASLADWENPSFHFFYKTYDRAHALPAGRYTPEAMAAEAVR
jgi:hypothetical protein